VGLSPFVKPRAIVGWVDFDAKPVPGPKCARKSGVYEAYFGAVLANSAGGTFPIEPCGRSWLYS
jgi:hypothetical protein